MLGLRPNHPQHQGVDEKPTNSSSTGSRRPAIGTRSPPQHWRQLGQQHRQRGLHHHETGRVVLRAPGQSAAAPAPATPRAPRPAMIGHRRIRPIGGNSNRSGNPASSCSQNATWAAIRLSGSSSSPSCSRCHNV
ncbi:hypothetical protein I552_0141 [Mycobacterium xenopi 3993]|nr:hypothetical protein I552_0141 [Mycobacterium xenopi 3993]